MISDPNYFCQSCQYNYKSRSNHRTHLRRAHKMNLLPLVKSSIQLSLLMMHKIQTTQVVQYAKKKYSNKLSYQVHVKNFHKYGREMPLNETIKSIANQNIQPDPNNPNFYCSSCQRQYLNRPNNRMYIRLFHYLVICLNCALLLNFWYNFFYEFLLDKAGNFFLMNKSCCMKHSDCLHHLGWERYSSRVFVCWVVLKPFYELSWGAVCNFLLLCIFGCTVYNNYWDQIRQVKPLVVLAP